MNERLKAIAAALAGLFVGAPTYRADADYDTPFLARELTQIESEMYRVEYADLLWREIIPVKNSGLNPAASSFVYKVWDWFGLAKYISNYADDLPNVGIRAKEVASFAHSMGASYQYSALELMQAGMAQISLEREEAQAAYESIERLMDHDAALGNRSLNMLGWANHPNVTISSPAANGNQNGGTNSTQFRHKTAAQMLADLYAIVFDMSNDTYQKFIPNEIVLPPSIYAIVATQAVSDLQPETTVLDTFLRVNPHVKSIKQWHHLETASATGGPRIVVQKKDPKNFQVYVPMEAKSIPPQFRNLATVVNIWARFGGFVLRQPLSMRYIDGAGPNP